MSDIKLSGKTIICPICNNETALEESQDNVTSWLCTSCGYTSNSLFTEDSNEFENTPKGILSLKKFDEERNIWWIPTVINIPSRGIIFPEKIGRKIIWNHVPIVEIPEEERHNYPIANTNNQYHTRKLEPVHAKKFTEFSEALTEIGAIIEMNKTTN